MYPHRAFARFLARCIALYVLLLVPWPGLADAYASAYRSGLSILLGNSDPEHAVAVLALRPRDTATAPEWRADTGLILRFTPAPGHPPRVNPIARSSHYTGYVPTALTVALILATPLAWARRATALLLGLLLANAFVAAMASLPVTAWFVNQQALIAPTARAGVENALPAILRSLEEAGSWMGPYYAAPLFIWMLAVFRRDHWPPWQVGDSPVRDPR